MYHHRYRPPSHLANKNVTAFASNNYSINSASSANSSSATTSSSSSSQATTTSNISTLASLSEVRNHHSGTSSNNNNSNIVNNNSLSHNSAYTEVVSKSFAEERQDVIFRRVRGILNKITPETFDKLSKELVNVGLDSPRTLRGVIYLLFDKALKDLKYSSLYAKLCQELSEKAPNFEQESGPNTFCKFLISKCEDEFERRRKATEDFDAKNELTDEEFEQKAIAKQKMLGNIKFICELGKKRLLQEEILHECIRGLLSKKRERPVQDQAQDLECLCQIMRTIGSLLDIQASRNLMNQYFERIDMYSKRSELPSRIRFMLRDVIDLRNNNWRPRPFQREDNVPQPLSRLREEAGYEASQNLAIDKLGNNKSLLGLGDLPKLHGSKLSSLLLDDEPSFTTSNDFHWGPTFLTPDPSFDVFSSNVPPKNNSSSTKPIKLVGAPSVTMSSSSTQKHPPNLLTMNNVVNIQHQIDPFSNSFRGNIILDRVPSTIDSNNPSHHTNIVETRRIPVSSSNHPPPLVRFSDQRPINRNDSPPLSKPAPRKLQNNDIRPPSIHPPSYQSYKSSPRMNRHEREFAGRREQRRFGPPQFEQFDRPPKHSDHHQSNFHSDRNYRPAPSRNQNMDTLSAPDFSGPQNGRREVNGSVGNSPMKDHLLAASNAINSPLLPKPDLGSGNINSSLRPSHNLSCRASSVTMSNTSAQKPPPNLTLNNMVTPPRQAETHSNLLRAEMKMEKGSSAIENNDTNQHCMKIAETRRIPNNSSTQALAPAESHDQRPSPRNDSPPLPKPAPRKLQNNDIRQPSIHPPSYQSYKSSPRMNRHEREFAGRREQRRFGPPQFEQFDRPPKHSDHHQSNFHSDRNYRPAPSRNQNMDAQPAQDSNRAQNGRREANDASKTTPVTTKRDHLPAIAHAINGPLLPKPISKLSDSNFSLRPSHNLSGRALSGAAQQVGQPKQAGVSQSSRSTEGVANVKIEAKVSNDFTGKVDNSQTASKITKVDNQEKVSASLDTSRDACHDSHVNKFIAVLSECSKESRSNANRLASKIKELKIPKGCHSECLVSAIKQSIVRAENDREGTSKLLVQIVPSLIDAASLLNAFRIIFEQLHGLEVETPKVKSLVAGFLSRAVYDGLLTMEDVAQVLSGGKHHPLFLLFLQKLEKSAGQVWLNERFMASKIVLMDMVPEVDRTKERLAIALKDRCLGFLDPMLTIEPDLWEQMKSDPSPAIVYRWIKDNVDQTIQVSPTFAHVLIACLLKYIHSTAIERSKVTAIAEQQQQRDSDTDGSSKSSPTTTSSSQSIMDVEKEFLTKYQQVLQAILKDKHMQLACLYALQAFFNSLDCPKGALLRWFHMMYELNIVDDDVFFTWKEEINDEIPGKGQALFQVNSWLNWLAEAESDEDEEDEEDEDDNGEDDID